ncbi:NIPSNAP family containing protein [Elizabethkingia ursingii]|uniref:NIPSNAP family containing protein n=2 Tax=Elizabethkingia ursingii TaxID=1756150 RepID=A0AAJ3N9W8_9FLAO|nr:NIPSNAP family containing protein [Elizabethkingia ursingii]OPB72180.1 NIPSNAP family containing protein [Elizabethkingia ursingii]
MKNKIIEILQYNLKKGTGEEFHQIMKEISVPLHFHHGIDVVSYGNSLHDLDCYYLIRSFDDEESMATALGDFYSGSDWKEGPREDIINRIGESMKLVLTVSQSAIEKLRKRI